MDGILSGGIPGVLDPRTAGLLQTGLGMMAASGPSRMPVSFGQALGQAGQQGMQAFQQANQQNMQQQLFGMKLAEAQRVQSERARQQAAIQELVKANPQLAPLIGVDPKGVVGALTQNAIPKQEKPQLVTVNTPTGPVQQWVRPGESSGVDVGGLYQPPQLVEVADQTDPLRTVRKWVTPGATDGPVVGKEKLPEILDPRVQAAKRDIAQAGAARMSVDNRQESEFGKTVGKAFGDQYADVMKADMAAPHTIAKYDRLGQLLGDVKTGKFKGTIVDLKAAAKAAGFDLSAMGIRDDVAPAQAARALSNMLALEMRNPAGGAGMPGAMSDKDREFLVQSIPGLENDPAAISTMIDYRKRLAKRDQQVAKMARDYRKRTNSFDEGFYDELAAWSAKNPLFPDGRFRVLGRE